MNPDVVSHSSTPKIPFLTSLRGKLLLVSLGLSLVPLLIVSAISFYIAQDALTVRVKSELSSKAKMQANMLHLWNCSTGRSMILPAVRRCRQHPSREQR
jgi:hypothetical protein